MKRTAGTMMLLAGLGGCVSPDGANTAGTATKPFNQAYRGVEAPGYVGSGGEPVHMTAGAARGAAPTGVVQAGGMMPAGTGVQQAAGWGRRNDGCSDCNVHTPGLLGHGGGRLGHGHGGGVVDPYAYGPMGHGIGTMLGNNGILPAPAMGPAGAVAAVGAIGTGSAYGPTITNQRTSIKFVNPQGMRVTWLGPAGYIEPGLTVPANYNFLQGNVYRLRLTGIPGRPGRVYYPTLEIAPVTPKTMTFLAHNTVPIAFTDDDFERVNAGNLVVKVIYLPEPQFQDLAAIAGAEEVVSTQLLPGEDPVIEATRRGTILAIIRIGNIDLENPFSPAMDSVPGGMAPPPSPTIVMPRPGAAPPPVLPGTPPGTLPRTPAPVTPKNGTAPKTTAAPAPKAPVVQASRTVPAPKPESKSKVANLFDSMKSTFTK
jgi:hypothetical protein